MFYRIFRIVLFVIWVSALLLSSGSSSFAAEVEIEWDASVCTDDCVPYGVDGYAVYWASSKEGLPAGTKIDVGDVLTTKIEIPEKTWIAVAAYNEKGDSGLSSPLFYGENGSIIQPATGGQISLKLVESLFSEDFESYALGADPTGWLDTGPDNSMAENTSLFKVFDVDGNKVFGSISNEDNIHSHYIDTAISGLSSYEYLSMVMMTDSNGGVGLTFFSDYNNSDTYYRIRQYSGGTFHVAPHPHGTVTLQGVTDSGVSISTDLWYNLKVLVVDTGPRTEIKAKVWYGVEPDWQIDCWDDSPNRLKSGYFGIWAARNGGKYFDDIEVR